MLLPPRRIRHMFTIYTIPYVEHRGILLFSFLPLIIPFPRAPRTDTRTYTFTHTMQRLIEFPTISE